MPFGPTHTAIRSLAHAAVSSFFAQVEVVGAENVPAEGPLIVCCNHWSMTVDPAVLSSFLPHGRKLHYWAKDSLFRNKLAGAILRDAGNIAVDRKTKNNQLLYSSTFDVLRQGECVAIFPEGTSYTEPGIRAIKDGASWTALEYAKNLREQGGKGEDVTIVVIGINYTSKTRYRSNVVLECAPPINVSRYADEFMQEAKPAVKKLTADIQREMTRMTVNAPDWDSLYAATMARQMIWRYDSDIPLRSYRALAQGLVNHFANADDPEVLKLRNLLLEYRAALSKAHLTTQGLGPSPLPRDLDPKKNVSLPSRLSTLFTLVSSTLASLLRLPFFVLPLIVHLPAYLAGRFLARMLNDEEEESFAQNKIVLGLLSLLLLYPGFWWLAWYFLYHSLSGAIVSFAFVYAFAQYHNALIDDNYRRARRLAAAWRVLLGVWLPRTAGSSAIKPSENDVRRVLRLRGEASRALHAHLLAVEREEGKEAGLVARLRAAGAKLASPTLASGSVSGDERVFVH